MLSCRLRLLLPRELNDSRPATALGYGAWEEYAHGHVGDRKYRGWEGYTHGHVGDRKYI